jgi:hypothetical protein
MMFLKMRREMRLGQLETTHPMLKDISGTRAGKEQEEDEAGSRVEEAAVKDKDNLPVTSRPTWAEVAQQAVAASKVEEWKMKPAEQVPASRLVPAPAQAPLSKLVEAWDHPEARKAEEWEVNPEAVEVAVAAVAAAANKVAAVQGVAVPEAAVTGNTLLRQEMK